MRVEEEVSSTDPLFPQSIASLRPRAGPGSRALTAVQPTPAASVLDRCPQRPVDALTRAVARAKDPQEPLALRCLTIACRRSHTPSPAPLRHHHHRRPVTPPPSAVTQAAASAPETRRCTRTRTHTPVAPSRFASRLAAHPGSTTYFRPGLRAARIFC